MNFAGHHHCCCLHHCHSHFVDNLTLTSAEKYLPPVNQLILMPLSRDPSGTLGLIT